MKKLSTIFLLILSSSAWAAFPATTNPDVVRVPELTGGLVFGLTGDYLEPSTTNGDLDYAGINYGSAPSSHLQGVQPGFSWGWGANIGYIFPLTGNDVNLNYMRLSTTDNQENILAFTPGASSFNVFNPSFIPGLPLTRLTSITSHVEYDINQLDLTAGQFIDVGCRLRLHPNVGLRWTSLDRTFDMAFKGRDTANIVNRIENDEQSDYSGIGPLVGLDASYYIWRGIGAVAHIDSALLIGNISDKSNENWLGKPGNVLTGGSQQYFNFTTNSLRRVVPVSDEKLGLDYSYLLSNAAQSDLTLEAGYAWSNYLNAVDEMHTSIADAGPSIITSRTTADVALHGFYATLTLHA